jgi:UDP-2,4-diacetamido-2,4,6-trideoxy-beta-L-altropyranose hydrolase
MPGLKVLFRCDAGPGIGGGHAGRCLALARALAQHGARVTFAVRPGSLEGAPLLGASGFSIVMLTGADDIATLADAGVRADVCIVDHYGLDAGFESAVRRIARRVVAIDDIPGRLHAADVLVDTAGSVPVSAWKPVAPGASILSGSEFALLRPDVVAARARAGHRRFGSVGRVLVSFGLVDSRDATTRTGRIVAAALPDACIDLTTSANAPHRASVESLVRQIGDRARLHIDSADYVGLLIGADMALGAGGVSALERACVGLPSVIVTTASNQAASAELLAGAGAAVSGGTIDDMDDAQLAAAAVALAGNPAARSDMAEAAMRTIDGGGAARLAAQVAALAAADAA